MSGRNGQRNREWGGERLEPGTRVRLIYCTDEYTRLEPGTEGEATFYDAAGTQSFRWEDGSTLGLVHAAGDRCEVLP